MNTTRIHLSAASLLVGLGVLVNCHHGDPATEPASDAAVVEPSADEAGEPEPEPDPGYPGELISTADMGRNFLARQRLKGKFGEQEFAFEAVLQLHGGTLTVLGLTPFGTKAFVLTQTGTEVEFESLIDREIPFPPEYMLQDIHRVWLWHTRLAWGDAPPTQASGVTDLAAPSIEVAGERVTEQWSENGLVRRTFVRVDGQPPGEIRIDYIGGHRTGRPAKQVVLENGWFGYRLEIQTTDWRML
jgi:hypothetical protein